MCTLTGAGDRSNRSAAWWSPVLQNKEDLAKKKSECLAVVWTIDASVVVPERNPLRGQDGALCALMDGYHGRSEEKLARWKLRL